MSREIVVSAVFQIEKRTTVEVRMVVNAALLKISMRFFDHKGAYVSAAQPSSTHSRQPQNASFLSIQQEYVTRTRWNIYVAQFQW